MLEPDGRAAARLSAAACVVAVVVFAWQAGVVTWQLWPLPAATEAPSEPSATPGAGNVSEVPLESIAAAALFGRRSTESSEASVEPAPRDAPETSLALTLRGILFNSDPANGLAIIEANGQAQLYATGASVPGGARIAEIYADRVILKRNGRHEALRLPKDAGEGTTTIQRSAPARAATGRGGQSSPSTATNTASLERLREQLVTDPTALQRYLQAAPVTDERGEIRGFRIQPGRDNALFERTGLRAGDIITRIGDTAITGQEAAMNAMQQLTAKDRVTLIVERGGQTRRILLDFNA